MSNYYTEASFIFPLTQKQAIFAIKVAECFCDKNINLLDEGVLETSEYSRDVITVAKNLLEFYDDFDYQVDDYISLGFDYGTDERGLWIHSDDDGYINGYYAAAFVHVILKHYDIQDYVAFETAFYCSKLALDSFGGTAFFITNKKIKEMSTGDWIYKQVKKHK